MCHLKETDANRNIQVVQSLVIGKCLFVFAEKKIVANFAIDFSLLWTKSSGVCRKIFKMVECDEDAGKVTRFLSVNSVTFRCYFRQEKSSSEKYWSYKRKTAKGVGWMEPTIQPGERGELQF